MARHWSSIPSCSNRLGWCAVKNGCFRRRIFWFKRCEGWISHTRLWGGAVYSQDDSDNFLRNSSLAGNLAPGGEWGGIFLLEAPWQSNRHPSSWKHGAEYRRMCQRWDDRMQWWTGDVAWNLSFHNDFANDSGTPDEGGAICVVLRSLPRLSQMLSKPQLLCGHSLP